MKETQQGDLAAESLESQHSPTSTHPKTQLLRSGSDHKREKVGESKKKNKVNRRPRSAGDINNIQSDTVEIDQVSSDQINSSTSTTEQSNPLRENSVITSSSNNSSSTSNSSSSGFLSFFGVKFNKSGTRHLDRSSSGSGIVSSGGGSDSISGEKQNNNKTVVSGGTGAGEHTRYTKFPLSPVSGQSPVYPVADSRFDETHIQLTPQTKTYTHPHKSPLPPQKLSNSSSSSSASSLASNFLASAVSSLGRKGGNQQLKGKSKSDNNLHRVTLNNSSNSSSSRNSSTNPNNLASIPIFPGRDSELRPNSVQLGDHATILIPWTGFQNQNNLSSITTNRVHHNTHNNIECESVRYVECTFLNSSTRTQSDQQRPPRFENNNRPRDTSRRRSRSLERSSNFRIFPSNSSTPVQHHHSQRQNSHNSKKNSNKSCTEVLPAVPDRPPSISKKSNSLERNKVNSHIVRKELDPIEKEILLKHINSAKAPLNLPGCRKLSELPGFNSFETKPTNLDTSTHHNIRTTPRNKLRPPPLGRLHSSAPNSSFSNSSESSSSSDSACASEFGNPPSPPPRPASTLKPTESRHIKKSRKARLPSPVTFGGGPGSRRSFPTTRSQDSTDSGHSGFGLFGSGNSDTAGERDSSSGSGPIQIGIGNMSVEDARTSGFINKPSKGWLHQDEQLSREGVSYTVRYIGCLDVNTSMKSLDFETRSLIAKECINQVCEAAGIRPMDRKRKVDRRVTRILGFRPRLDNAGSDVYLTITSTCLKLTNLDTGNIIAVNEMPNISFASGGDSSMLDFVSYVAKDSMVGRACFVLECSSGQAQDVITTIGQAFELRFKEYLQKRPQQQQQQQQHQQRLNNNEEDRDREYYNDLPNKFPPELPKEGGQNQSNNTTSSSTSSKRTKETPTALTLRDHPTDKDLGVNLIDFEAPTPPAFSTPGKNLESLLLAPTSSSSISSTTAATAAEHQSNLQNEMGFSISSSISTSKDPFDMQPFGSSLLLSAAGAGPPFTTTSTTTTTESEKEMADPKTQLEKAIWFHGTISRAEAEELVRNDGDFLVREQTTKGQYVLTGLQLGSPKHLLLVDPEGVCYAPGQLPL